MNRFIRRNPIALEPETSYEQSFSRADDGVSGDTRALPDENVEELEVECRMAILQNFLKVANRH